MNITIIIITLVLSAFFSGMELAFVASNRLRIEIDRKQNSLFDGAMKIFLRHPGQYISAMLVGNNISLVVYSLYMSNVIGLYLTSNIAIDTLISTLLILILAEFLPKGIVRTSPNRFLRVLVLPAAAFYMIFYPVTRFMSWLSYGILYILGVRNIKQVNHLATPGIHDLQSLVDQNAENGEENEPGDNDLEFQILQNALVFPELKVRECMVPRVEVVAADIDDKPEELLAMFQSTHYSRIPLYQGTIDNIVGYVSSRDMFSGPTSLHEVRHDIIYVPSSGAIKKLLGEFIRSRRSMAVVIDEFGSTAGVITLEDILEQIVGEIEDEHDKEDIVERDLGNGRYLLSARLEIDYLNEKYGFNIPQSDQYDTLAGFLLVSSENMPKTGQVINFKKLTVKVVGAADNRITLVELQIN